MIKIQSYILFISLICSNYATVNGARNATLHRNLQQNVVCSSDTAKTSSYASYFRAMQNVYRKSIDETCLPVNMKCGWPRTESQLPLFVIAVGLEGAGHHLWSGLFKEGIFEGGCVWPNARHYRRDVGDGVPRTTPEELQAGLKEQFALRKALGKKPCKTIYDGEDSFPTGALRRKQRMYMHPDIINLQKLDGKLINVKYLVILRNSTDTVMSALRRNFVTDVEHGIRIAEHVMAHTDASLRGVPCHRTFIAHYEHFLSNPEDYVEPLSEFLELDAKGKKIFEGRARGSKKPPVRVEHTLTNYAMCKGMSKSACYTKIRVILDSFFNDRRNMWPVFAGNGYDWNSNADAV